LLTPFVWIYSMFKLQKFSHLPIKDLNRKKLSGLFASLLIIFFIGIGIFAEPVEKPKSEIVTEQKQEEVLSNNTQVSSIEIATENVRVNKVVDGDTIELESGQKIRYIGIDTPESVDPGKPVECFSEEAAKKNRDLVEGKEIRLETDISDKDRYGRLLRYVWINDSLINEILVREGYAKSSTYPPDVKYQERFNQAEKLAREEEKGLWGNICSPNPTYSPTTKPTNTPKPTNIPTVKPAVQVIHTEPSLVPYVAPTTYYIPVPTNPPLQNNTSSWTCNCSKTCTQISSCSEAYFQLNNCGCGIRDGDNDGVPCENLCE